MLFQALRRVSCTRSSARSMLPHNDTANARRLGTRRNIASLTGADTRRTGTPPWLPAPPAGKRSGPAQARLRRPRSAPEACGRSGPAPSGPALRAFDQRFGAGDLLTCLQMTDLADDLAISPRYV